MTVLGPNLKPLPTLMAGLNPSSEGERVVGEKRVRNLREPVLGDRNIVSKEEEGTMQFTIIKSLIGNYD